MQTRNFIEKEARIWAHQKWRKNWATNAVTTAVTAEALGTRSLASSCCGWCLCYELRGTCEGVHVYPFRCGWFESEMRKQYQDYETAVHLTHCPPTPRETWDI